VCVKIRHKTGNSTVLLIILLLLVLSLALLAIRLLLLVLVLLVITLLLLIQEAQALRISRQSAHECGKVISPMHRPSLPPGNIPGTHFC
jgi:hypothetical protein